MHGACASAGKLPAAWVRRRRAWREYLAEFWGTFTILLFGAGVECQVRLHLDETGRGGVFGDYLSCRLAWASGVALGAWVAGGISGAHINPVVTVAMALLRRFPRGKILGYMAAQVLGCVAATFVVYGLYRDSILFWEDGAPRAVGGPRSSADMFVTRPSSLISLPTAYATEFVATGAMMFLVLAVSDGGHWGLPRGVMPVGLFFIVLAIGSALGFNTGYALNPARDTGPRIALYFLGYGNALWTHDDGYWFFGPWCSSSIGAAVGAFLYDASLYEGTDSVLWAGGGVDESDAARGEEAPSRERTGLLEAAGGTAAAGPAHSRADARRDAGLVDV
ncbi:hypothetical protein MSPP1_004084 [Malassezia sp. CBS 17886]|nr:hypothetical protein MSPP1_004084 [Malassezia sp. CBS 17886]